MSLFKNIPADAILINRKDPNEILSSFSKYTFFLDDYDWPTSEHYYQAKKFLNTDYQQKIRGCPSAKKAHKMGNTWFRRKRADIKKVRVTLMVRATYTQCRTHENVRQALLETGDCYIAENSFSDYFWGCGRDGRGKNNFGKVLMNVRAKLRDEATGEKTYAADNKLT